MTKTAKHRELKRRQRFEGKARRRIARRRARLNDEPGGPLWNPQRTKWDTSTFSKS